MFALTPSRAGNPALIAASMADELGCMKVRLAAWFTFGQGKFESKLSRIEWLSRLASILLTAVLVLSTAFVFETAKLTSDVAGRVNMVRSLTENLRAAQFEMAREQSLEREYRLSPEGLTFVAHRTAAANLAAAMQAVRAQSDPDGRLMVDRILAEQRSYLTATRRLFVATNRADAQLVVAIARDQVDPIYDDIVAGIEDLAKHQAAIADEAIRQFKSAQRRVIDISVILSLVGIVSLGCFLGIVGTYRGRLEKTHEAELKRLENTALLDALTGIGNHRAFRQDLLRELSRAERHQEALTLALLDVDDFKIVNDRDGHLHGDRVLASLAELLTTLRAEDRAYRVGGDEFAIILPQTSAEAARHTIARLQTGVAASLFGNTISIGIATIGGDAYDMETLQSQADAAMYAAKRSGRNTIIAFDESLSGQWLLSPTKIHSLRQLIATRAVTILFQPIWDMQRCRILAYEALARPDPAFGFAGPQDAFDLAERTGRAHELDAVCRSAALAAAVTLPSDALLFLNVSPQSLDYGRLAPADLLAAVRAVGMTPQRVVIEITERSITQVDAVIAAALDLQQHGFRLALDDTGAGNSGLEMLSRLPLDFVKIDREVIVKGLVDRKARGVVAGIVAIAKATGAYVIAEGIETTEMLEFVCGSVSKEIDVSPGIHGVQGYLLRRPLPTFLEAAETDDVAALLREFTGDCRPAPLSPPADSHLVG